MANRQFRQGARVKHGMTKTREYRAWSDMLTRCTNPNFIKYEYYGGKGIKVCERWLGSFLAFYEDMGKCPPKHSLDRKKSTKDYEPGNCRWATQSEQMRNTSRTRLLTFKGKTQCLTDWAIEYGMSWKQLACRLDRGMTIEQALTAGTGRHSGRYITFNGKTLNIRQWADETGIAASVLVARYSKGWSVEKALTTPTRKKRKCQSQATMQRRK